MTITAMLRVRNEGRWLREVLQSIQPLTRDIVIFDDHSTDDTREIAEDCGCEVVDSPYPSDKTYVTNETRDKNHLLDHVRRRASTGYQPTDYVLCIDGDEVLEADAADKIRAKLKPELCVYSFPIRYLWNDRERYRADGVYGRFTRASMFSLVGQSDQVKFASTHGCNFHCGNVPANLKGSGCMIPMDLLHLGYMDASERERKYVWYNAKDPGNWSEDRYRHVAAGLQTPHAKLIEMQARLRAQFGLPELRPDQIIPPAPSAEERCLHGGPLKVYSLPQGKWPV